MARTVNLERRDARRKQILDAVEMLVLESGLEALTMQSVIRKSGLSAGVVYHHFANKDAILNALVIRLNRDNGELIEALNGNHSVCEVLCYIANDMLEELCSPHTARLQVELSFRVKSGAPWAMILRDAEIELERELRKAIAADIKQGRIKQSNDARVCVALLLSLWEGLVSRASEGALPARKKLLPHYLRLLKEILA